MPIENQTVRDYLLQKQKEREELKAKLDSDAGGPNIGAALAAIGAGFQGKDSVGAGQAHLDRAAKQRQGQLSDFDASTDSYLKGQDAMLSADKADREKSLMTAEDDVNSEESKIASQLASRMGYKGGPISATKFKSFSPALQKMYEIEQKKIENSIARQDKKDLKEQKAEELNAVQSKQAGLVRSGSLAEQQFRDAVTDSKDFDPTDPLEFIDNSNWAPAMLRSNDANKARSSQDAWIESFLRDASGAAIPEAERNAYRAQFFPQPGDSSEVAANKEALRLQKMDNARMGAGKDMRQAGPLQFKSKQATKVVNGITYKKVPGGWEEVTAGSNVAGR